MLGGGLVLLVLVPALGHPPDRGGGYAEDHVGQQALARAGHRRLDQVQRPGGKRLAAHALLQARPDLVGRRLGTPAD